MGDVKFGDLKGEDSHGNKYFENKEYPYGERWTARSRSVASPGLPTSAIPPPTSRSQPPTPPPPPLSASFGRVAPIFVAPAAPPHPLNRPRPTQTTIASTHTKPLDPHPPYQPPFRRAPSCSSPNQIPNPGQHRWVEYADIHNYDSSTVTAAWHPWLHHMSDFTPSPAAMVSLISVLFWFCFCGSVLCSPPPTLFFFFSFSLSFFFFAFSPLFFSILSAPPFLYIFPSFPSYFSSALYLACLGSQGFLSKSMAQRPDECEIQ